MVCNNCGCEVPDGQLTCGFCGGYVNSTAGNFQQMNYNQPNNFGQSNNFNQPNNFAQQNSFNQPNNFAQQNSINQTNNYNQQNDMGLSPKLRAFAQAEREGLGMKWFKFVIYFQLFFSALYSFVLGLLLVTGQAYTDSNGKDVSKLVYEKFESLKTVDMIVGFLFLALAVYAIIVRNKLAGFKKDAPKMYLGLLICNIAVSIIYIIAVVSITDIDMGSSYLANLSMSFVLLAANITYFKKREHLFNN